jgi:hypothetical protein
VPLATILIPGAIAYIRLRLRPGADGKTKPSLAKAVNKVLPAPPSRASGQPANPC